MKKINKDMFPFMFLGVGIASWWSSLFNPKSNNTMIDVNYFFDINKYKPSEEILKLKGEIEGFENVAYKRVGDPVTVGTGLTHFGDGTKPILGKFYETAYLNERLRIVSKAYIERAKVLAISAGIVPVNQKQMDVLYYMFFNGFLVGRQTSWKLNHSTNIVMANWMMTRNGIGGNFLVGSDRRFFVGIISSRYRLANYLSGKNPNEGLSKFLSQFPRVGGKYNQPLAADMYNQGKIKIPLYL